MNLISLLAEIQKAVHDYNKEVRLKVNGKKLVANNRFVCVDDKCVEVELDGQNIVTDVIITDQIAEDVHVNVSENAVNLLIGTYLRGMGA